MKERGIVIVGSGHIGSTTIRHAQIISENVLVVNDSPKSIEEIKLAELQKQFNNTIPFMPPLTRAQRRKLKRKK